MTPPSPIIGACVWRGAELEQSRRWVRELPADGLDEIERAVRQGCRSGRAWRELTRESFPLPRCADFLADVADELENGCGMVLLRGLPVERYSEEELRALWFGLGVNFGRPVFQNRTGERAAYPLPVFGQRDGRFTSHYSLTYIEAAQLMPEAPRLSAAQREAIDMLMATAEELSFAMTLAPGDIQLLNNHVIYHGRTPFADDAASGRDRLLLRLWLSMPNSRALPEGHEVLWRRIEAGAPRGGIGQEAA